MDSFEVKYKLKNDTHFFHFGGINHSCLAPSPHNTDSDLITYNTKIEDAAECTKAGAGLRIETIFAAGGCKRTVSDDTRGICKSLIKFETRPVC
jgi:hypothetical protein